MADRNNTVSKDGKLTVGILVEVIVDADSILRKGAERALGEFDFDGDIETTSKKLELLRGKENKTEAEKKEVDALKSHLRKIKVEKKRKDKISKEKGITLKSFGVDSGTLNKIRQLSIKVRENTYKDVNSVAHNKLLDFRDDYQDGYNEEGIFEILIDELKKHKVNTSIYHFDKNDDDSYDTFCEKLHEEADKSIPRLGNLSPQNANDFGIRILAIGDDEGVRGNINQVIESIQENYANPIVMISETKTDQAYDLFYCVIDHYVPKNALNIITKIHGVTEEEIPIIRVYVRDVNDMALKEFKTDCIQKGISIKPFSDSNSYKYDLFNDLKKIIKLKEAYVREFIANKQNELKELLDENDNLDLESIDFKTYERALNIYKRHGDENKWLTQLISAYVSEKAEIAAHLAKKNPTLAEKVYEELCEIARETEKCMGVLLEYAEFLKNRANEGDNGRAIEVAEELERYWDYKKDDDIKIVELYYFLGTTYDDGKHDEKALLYYENAQKKGGLNQKCTAEIIARKATVMWRLHQYKEAEDYIERNMDEIKKIYESNEADNTWAYAKLFQTSGSLAHARMNLEEALKLDEQALNVWKKKSKLDRSEKISMTSVYGNMAIYCRKMGRYNKAWENYNHAVSIRREIYRETKSQKHAFALSISLSNMAYFLWTAERDKFEMDGNFEYTAPQFVVSLYEESKHLKEGKAEKKNDNKYDLSMLRFYLDYACYWAFTKTWYAVDEYFDRAFEFADKLLSSKNNGEFDIDVARLKCFKGICMLDRLEENQMPSPECEKMLLEAREVIMDDAKDGYYTEYDAYVNIALLRLYVIKQDKIKIDIFKGRAIEIVEGFDDTFAEKKKMRDEISKIIKNV